MKKKIFSVLFAVVLVLSFSLVTAVPVSAQATLNVIPFTVNDDGSAGAATWDTTQQHSGISSVKLVNNDITDGNDFAEVFFGVDIALEDIDLEATSFYCYSDGVGTHIPYFIFEIPGTYPNNGVMLRIGNDAALSTGFTADWAQFVASTTTSQWQCDIVDANYVSVATYPQWKTWDALVTEYGGDLIVNCVVVELSDITAATGVHTVYVDDVTISGTTYDLEGTAADHTTIQSAITAAALTGDTIIVAPGIYNTGSGETFPITLGKSLTLSGPNALISPNTGTRVAEAIIDGQISLSGAIDAVIIQGFHFVVTPGVASINCPGGFDGDNLNILKNSFTAAPATDVNWEVIGVHPNTAVAGLVIDDNLVTGVRGIFVNPQVAGSDVTITNNVIDGDPSTPAFAGISVDGVSGVISDNEISYTCDAGINVGSAVGPCDGLTISNNTVTHAGCCDWGNAGAINLYSDCTNITITGNTLSDSWDGITIKDMGPLGAGIVINFNNISGNRHFGVLNSAASGALNAINNWWNHASGPTASPGYGDKVSGDVLYDPWLLAPIVTGAPIPTTGFDKTLTLLVDWTLVSTDNWIDPAETVGVGVIIAYNYTPSDGYWEVTPADLVPVNALYVKTEDGGALGITYSGGVPVASSKDLEAGWNLISSATIDDARAILSPLRYIDVGEEQGVGLATLVSQGNYNLHSGSFCLSTVISFDWLTLGNTTLNPFDGYWVYMNAGKVFGVVPD